MLDNRLIQEMSKYIPQNQLNQMIQQWNSMPQIQQQQMKQQVMNMNQNDMNNLFNRFGFQLPSNNITKNTWNY